MKCHRYDTSTRFTAAAYLAGPGGRVETPALLPASPDCGLSSLARQAPVVLDDSQFAEWMRGTPDQAAALMKPYAGAIEAWEVGAEVGNVKNNRSELMERVGLL